MDPFGKSVLADDFQEMHLLSSWMIHSCNFVKIWHIICRYMCKLWPYLVINFQVRVIRFIFFNYGVKFCWFYHIPIGIYGLISLKHNELIIGLKAHFIVSPPTIMSSLHVLEAIHMDVLCFQKSHTLRMPGWVVVVNWSSVELCNSLNSLYIYTERVKPLL